MILEIFKLLELELPSPPRPPIAQTKLLHVPTRSYSLIYITGSAPLSYVRNLASFHQQKSICYKVINLVETSMKRHYLHNTHRSVYSELQYSLCLTRGVVKYFHTHTSTAPPPPCPAYATVFTWFIRSCNSK